MYNYIINNPIGRLGNHIIALINLIFMHLFLNKTIQCNNNYLLKICLHNNHNLINHISQFTINTLQDISTLQDNSNNTLQDNNHNTLLNNNHNNTLNNNVISRNINGYDIFHLSNLFLTKNIHKKICFWDYLYIANKSIHKLWSQTAINSFKQSIIYFTDYISQNYINLDTTLVIHIKCTDNTIPEKVIHKKYNIYPNKLYLEICKSYNYDTILIITDNPKHILIQNLLSYNSKSNIRILCASSNMETDLFFLINAKNLLIDNSTFTWICGLHPFIYNHTIKHKTLFLYKDFFEKFFLDINTNDWDKTILNFCINKIIPTINFNTNNISNISNINNINNTNNINYKNNKNNLPYINYYNITGNKCNCSCINDKEIHIYNPRSKKNVLQELKKMYTIILFDYDSRTKIQIGDWIGNQQQINSLLL